MAINFPSSPINGQTYTDPTSGTLYVWDGVVWLGYGNIPVASIQGWNTNNAGIHTLSNVGVGTTNPTSRLTVSGDGLFTGVVTATSFIGDGSGLSGVVATGSGVEIRDDNSLVGTAATINFGNNISVTFSSGIATVTSSGSVGGGSSVTVSDTPPGSPLPGNLWYDSTIGRGFIYYNDGSSSQWVDFSPTGAAAADLVSSQWVTTATGIHTLTSVGIGTTNPTSRLTVRGDGLFTGVVTATSFSGNVSYASSAGIAQGLTGSPNVTLGISTVSSLNVTNISNFSNAIKSTRASDAITLVDGGEIQLGNLTPAQIYNGGSNTLYIRNTQGSGTGGTIEIQGRSGVSLYGGGTGGSNLAINANSSGAAELLYQASKKLETLSTGASVYGNLNVSGILTASQIDGTIIGAIANATNLTGGTANASSLNVSGIATISQGRIQADAAANLRFGNIAAGAGSVRNIAIGDQVLVSLSGGSGRNIGIGELSYYDTTTGQYNIGIGERAGQKVSTGAYNVILGSYDGNSQNLDIRTSSNNVVIADGQGNIRQYINSSGNVGIKTTVITNTLTVGGSVTATSYSGSGSGLTNIPAGQLTGQLPAIDGSKLTGVVATGTGVEVRDDNTAVGTANTINFGTNLEVSFAAGIATISGSTSVAFASVAGLATTATNAQGLIGSPNIAVTNLDAVQIFIGDCDDVTAANNKITMGQDSDLEIFHLDDPPLAEANWMICKDQNLHIGNRNNSNYQSILGVIANGSNPYARLSHSSSARLETTGYGVTVFGGVNATGIVTASSFSGSGSGLTNIPSGQLTGALPAIDGSALLNVTASGSGIAVRDGATELGSAATVNFGTGLDVTVSGGIATVTASGGSLQSRTTVTGVTTSIANNGIGNTNITGFKSYALMRVGLSTAGWLRLYTDSTSRANDVSRSVGEDPTPGSGVSAEVVTTGISTTQIISPFVMGGNLDNPADTTIYAAITNFSGITTNISVNLTLLQLEA